MSSTTDTESIKAVARVVAELCAGLLSGLVVTLLIISTVPNLIIGPWAHLRIALIIGAVTVLHLTLNATLTRWSKGLSGGSTWSKIAASRSSGLSSSLRPVSLTFTSSAQNSFRTSDSRARGSKSAATKTCGICQRVRESRAFAAVARVWRGTRPNTPPNLSKNPSPPASQKSVDGGASMGEETEWKLPSSSGRASTGKPKRKNGRKPKSTTSFRKKSQREVPLSSPSTKDKNPASVDSESKTLIIGAEFATDSSK